jgi:FlaA1/EpsC-like NDP-sugar epimerase
MRLSSNMSLRLAKSTAKLRSDMPLILLDAVLVAGAHTGVLILRFEGAVPAGYWLGFRPFVLLAVVVALSSNWICGLYGQMWRHASIVEARHVLSAGALTLTVLAVAFLAGDLEIPLSVLVLGTAAGGGLIGVLRFQARLFGFRRRGRGEAVTRVLLVGAGESGGAILREMLRAPEQRLRPVGVVDDDPRKIGLSILGVPILAKIDDLPAVAKQHGAEQVLLSMPSADGEMVRRVLGLADAAGLPVKVLPSVAELLGGAASVRDVRDLQITDLLGRQQVNVDLEAVREILQGRTVLITGAGGSIGSEIARQVGACSPRELVLLDNDETHLHDVAATLGVAATQALVDIRDVDLLSAAFARHRPDVVFHAAAHKHVPILEMHPGEAIRTNALGTRNVVEVCKAIEVERLVFVSTDKAVNPSSVMGASKRLAEQLLLAGRPAGARYCAVRFGNVLGSRGSVIPTFMRQIAEGGPVTVTDPRMTRFFMSIPEAVQLVLQAATFCEGGEIFMLEMGEPVRIVDLAERMIRLSGREVGTDVELRVVGMRPGEKLHEELQAPEEKARPTAHPSVVALEPTPISPILLEQGIARLCGYVRRREDHLTKAALFALVRPSENVLCLPNVQKAEEGRVALREEALP